MYSKLSNQQFTIRPFMPTDQPEVDRLIEEGVLSGHLAYESTRIDRIRQAMGSERERFLVAEADG